MTITPKSKTSSVNPINPDSERVGGVNFTYKTYKENKKKRLSFQTASFFYQSKVSF